MARFVELIAVARQVTPNCYTATIIADIDGDGTTEEVLYGVVPDDNYGIAPQVKAAVTDWIDEGKPVAAYVPPTLEEIRAYMPKLTRRQLLLGLLSIGITEISVDAALVNDAEGMIEWKNASSFERTHPLISGLSVIFGLPDSQVDSLWLWTAQL